VEISKHDVILPAEIASFGSPCHRAHGAGSFAAAVVLGVLANGGFFASVRQVQKWVKQVAHKKVSRNCVHRTILRLMDEGYIERIYRGSYKARKASIYRLTSKYQMLLQTSDLFYHSLSDIRDQKNCFSSEDQRIKQLTNPEFTVAVNHHQDWKSLLPKSTETDQFITSLRILETYQISFRRLDALTNAHSLSGLHQTYPLKHGNFQISYKPLATGRLQGVPHTYIGKDLSRFIRPAEDPNLENGFLFSLDYSQQELRLLAYYCKDSTMLKYANDTQNMFNQMIGQFQMHTSIRACRKHAVYSFIYGSDGWALKEALDKEYGFNPKHLEYARVFGSELRRLYPSITNFQHSLERGLIDSRSLVAPGGVMRTAEFEDRAITKKGKVSKKWARRTALSHFIQGAGAWIARKVVTAEANLRESRLFMPVHDGFIFYSQSNDPTKAIIEAQGLLESCAKEIAPHILIPSKLEWSIGRKSNVI